MNKRHEIKHGDKLYIVTRNDLSSGAQAVQGMHALREFVNEHPDVDDLWYTASNHIVFLSVKNKEELYKLCDNLCQKMFKFSMFHEPDLNDELTAIAIEPAGAILCKKIELALK